MAKKNSKRRVHSGKGDGRAARKVVRRQTSKKKGASSKANKTEGPGLAALALEAVTWCHAALEGLLKDWPEEKLTHQVSPTDNHPVWTMGHLSTGYEFFASLLDGKPPAISEQYKKLFGFGSQPVANAANYPSMSEVRAAKERSWNRLLDAVKAQSDADMLKPPTGDASGMAKNRFEVVRLICWHDGWHQGQLSSQRKALGLRSIFG